MLRRLSVLLLIWVGLLGAAAPAFACPMAAQHDCCPPQAPSPCGGAPAEVICCVGTPASSQAVSVNSSRLLKEFPASPSGTPDLPVLPVWVASFPDLAHLYDMPASAPSAPRTDAALTYLRTGRLRL